MFDVACLEQLGNGVSGFVIGIGLSAACGFRVIVPFLGLSIAAMNGVIPLTPEFQWIGTGAALWAFATAAVLEVGAYYIPWMDNLLDSVATPLAVAAGIVATASVMTDTSPFLKWAIAVIAGGGMAGTIQAGTALLRGVSSVSTGGAANFFVSTAELVGSVMTTFLSLLLPVIAFLVAMMVAVWIMVKLLRRRHSSG